MQKGQTRTQTSVSSRPTSTTRVNRGRSNNNNEATGKSASSSNNSSSKRTSNLKRNFNVLNQESIVERSKLTIIKTKIDDLYRKYLVDTDKGTNTYISTSAVMPWKNSFKDLFEKERIIDFSHSEFIPKSLDQRGAYCMGLEKFWILWIEIVKKELTLKGLVLIINNAIQHVVNTKMMTDHFGILFNELKLTKKAIIDYCKDQNITYQDKPFLKNYAYLLENRSILSEMDKSELDKSAKVMTSTGKKMKLSPCFGHPDERKENLSAISKIDFNNISNITHILDREASSQKDLRISEYIDDHEVKEEANNHKVQGEEIDGKYID